MVTDPKTQKLIKFLKFQFSEFSKFFEFLDVQSDRVWVESHLVQIYLLYLLLHLPDLSRNWRC